VQVFSILPGELSARLLVKVSSSEKSFRQMKRIQELGKQSIYSIKVEGILDPCWSEWFDGMTVTPQANGETLLIGRVRDQAALHGLLVKIRDIGLPLLLLKRVDTHEDFHIS